MDRLFLFLHSVFGWTATVVLLVVLSPCAWLTAPLTRDTRRHYHRWARLWAQGVLLACRVKVEVDGLDRLSTLMGKGPHVLVSNHGSILDIPILLAALPGDFAFLSKVELFSIPLMGRYMEACGFIPIQRGNRQGTGVALDRACQCLIEGRSVMVFPEGTRSADGNLGHFKRGAVLLAASASVPILPLAIVGSFSLMSRQTMLQRPGPVSLRFGPPFQPCVTDLEAEDSVASAIARMRGSVETLCVRPSAPLGVARVPSTRRAG
jgi:1-acyl-sn-glycerol-3-phosphate acyltransferase